MTQPSFLIVKLGAVGDCVHTLYALGALRRAYPEARIGWLVEEKSAQVVEGHPDLNEVILFPRKKITTEWKAGNRLNTLKVIRDFQRDLQNRHYDTTIDFQNLLKTGYFSWVSCAPHRIGFKRLREGNFLFTNQRIEPAESDRHAIEKYFALLRPLGISEIPQSAGIFIPEQKKNVADEFFKVNGLNGNKVVAINPGASWPNKRLMPEKYAAAADELFRDGVRSVILWGPGEEGFVEQIRRASTSGPLTAPRTDIKELFYFLSRCDLYLGNDSGPMHMAAAAGRAVVAVFGPSDPARVGPWTKKAAVVTADVPCRPCWKKSCPLPKVECMEKIGVEDLVKPVRRLLGLM